MPLQEVWTDRKVLAKGPLGLELSSVSFFLFDELNEALPNSLRLQVVARIFGVQIGSTTINPLKNGAFSMPLLSQIGGDLNGRIDDLRPLDANGSSVAWSSAVGIGFTITALGDLVVPLATVLSIVPGLGAVAKAALAIFGNKLTINLAHDDVVVHLPRQTGSLFTDDSRVKTTA